MEKFLGVLGAIGIVLLLIAIFAYPVMLLWNWLMPVIFGLPVIGFWQTVGLMILANVFFKSTSSN